jgi:hypothetical protein
MVLKGLGEGEVEATRLKDSLASRLVNWGLEKIEKGGVENIPSEVEAGALLIEEVGLASTCLVSSVQCLVSSVQCPVSSV